MKGFVVKQALDILSDSDSVVHDPLKFFKENEDDVEFLWFLKIFFDIVKDHNESIRDKLGSKIGEDLAGAFWDQIDNISYQIDKNKLDNVLYADDFDEMKSSMKILMKGKKIEE